MPKFILSLGLTLLLAYPPFALGQDATSKDLKPKAKKHGHFHKKKGSSVKTNLPEGPQTEVTDQREVSQQPAKPK